MATELETCRVSPPPGAAADELTLPLSFFDMMWIHFHPLRYVLFYDHPCSKSEFLERLVPKLKQSLSLTLKHYLPAAGNLVFPTNTDDEKPVLRYATGDSVHLTIAESSSDFDALVGNQARDADQFYDFVPQMPPVVDEPGHKLVPLISLKLTLFPDRGICVGIANNHVLGDANSIVRFVLAWASINKSAGDDEFVTGSANSLPNFDRSVLQNTNEVNSSFWKVFGKIPLNESSPFPVPTNRVRSTFILTQTDIKKLKDLVISKKPDLNHVSSFVVTTSYVWTCLVKSGNAIGEKVRADESEVLFFPADGRGRLNALIDPPVPLNYFGNCLGAVITDLEHEKVVGEDGFVAAAEVAAVGIEKGVKNKDEFLKGPENWLSGLAKFGEWRVMGVSGSPKFNMGDADFGWGKARKYEVVSIDGEKYTISICKSRDFEGGLEVGLSLTKERMEAFAALFVDGLN